MFRFFDIFLSVVALIASLPIMIVVCIGCWLDSGSPFFLQNRLGLDQKVFTLIKFRTLPLGTPNIGTHQLADINISFWGRLLRQSKLDELPQLLNVLRGDMSLVGPRPSLPNQEEVIQARVALGVYTIRPGLTGLAQVRSVDMRDAGRLSALDRELIDNLTLIVYFKILAATFVKAYKPELPNGF